MRNAIRRIVGVSAGVAALAALGAPAALAAQPASGDHAAPASAAHSAAHRLTVDRRIPAVVPPKGGAAQAAPSVMADDPYTVAKNPSYQGETCGTNTIDQATGWGPMTLTLTQSRAIATTWNASLSISPWKVGATVGFSVTDTVTKTEAGAYTVPAGKYGYIKAFPLYDYYTFEVWNTQVNKQVGWGEVRHPAGFCYDHSA
ncbi:hypothetical protein AB0442_36000 [Kitasatospora sp. NPDC085895]|uniref:hypothetical protein n=1 Tax=Kitasatospora sp. NPDC085895 TaxID=3155057 RepID=UPI00344DED9B